MMNHHTDGEEAVPLRAWMDGDLKKQLQEQPNGLQLSLLRKTTVAYAVSGLLRRAITSVPMSVGKISLDNFVVRTRKHRVDSDFFLTSSTADILGVEMISEKLTLTIIDSSQMNHLSDESEEGGGGKYLEVCIAPPQLPESSSLAFEQIDERSTCHLFGIFLYELYSNSPFPKEILIGTEPTRKSSVLGDEYGGAKEPPTKKATSLTYSVLHDLNTPPNIIMLVQNLVESKCDHPLNPKNVCSSMKEASDDLHLLLHEPSRFLFTRNQFECGNSQLQFRQNRLYGREKEVSLISDAFNRVSAGGSEAFFIGGYSGSGKTRLVNEVMALVEIRGGYVLNLKFNHISEGRPLLELISTFNGLCSLIRTKKSPQELQTIVNQLSESVGADLSMLGRLLPNVYSLLPKGQMKKAREQGGNRMNFQSVCFILRQFMKVVSSRSHPVVLFLDDLQWSDSTALDVIHHILSDQSDARCFFVGSYRSNEVSPDHAIFEFIQDLEASGVPTQKLMLDGMKSEDVNALISDSLCTFPRTTQSLSTIIHEKTEGNPFFCLEFLRSLVDRSLLRYSLRRGTWDWDEDKIGLENTTDNVLYLLSSKMNGLTSEVQLVLKVLSSFGIKVNENIITYLNSTSQYSGIIFGIEEARSKGFVSKAGESSCFSFAHDKVREAAYSLIPDKEKHEFHSKLGMALINASKGDDLDDATVLTIVCQINRNVPSLKQSSTSMRVEVSSLNYKAGLVAMKRSDYETASHYLSLASQILPDDHWGSNYELSLQLYIAIAKASYSFGDTDKSRAALDMILKEATCMEDKLDAYSLVVFIHHSQERGEEAYTTCQDVLTQLGEVVPECLTPEESMKIVQKTTSLLEDLSGEALRAMNDMDMSKQAVVQFYSFMAQMSWFSRPEMVPYISLRIAEITMENGLCKYSLVGFVQFAFVLCNARALSTVQVGCRIGEVAMSMLDYFDYSEIKSSVTSMYSYVHQHCYPIQKVADSSLKGFEFGIASGDTVSAFFNAVQQIRLSIFAGSTLPDLLRETDKYLSIVGHHRNTVSRAYLLTYRQTISTLIGINTVSAFDEEESKDATEPVYEHRRAIASNFHQAFQSFWLGYNERCHHYLERILEMNHAGGHHLRFGSFYFALNAFSLSRKGQLIKAAKLKKVAKDALTILREAEELSAWNYRNKVLLLQGELHSHEGKIDEAEAAYGAAITSARASLFIHEEGLACECAAFHCKRNGKFDHAVNFFHQAKLCYNEWGSSMKVDFCIKQMNQIRNS